MRVFVTGVGGQLGHDVMNELASRHHEAIGSDIQSSYSGIQDGTWITKARYVPLDITDEATVRKVLLEFEPDAVIHCAAWTAVDSAEEEDNWDTVHRINVGGTRNIALACRDVKAKMMYISTDYVFNGNGEEPWEADCKDFKPLNHYGLTKLEGEQEVIQILDAYFIVRIAWVFGKNGKNFVRTMLELGKKNDQLRVVNDQIGTPTYTLDLARLLVDMIETERFGFYHATNEGGYISWYDFACEIFRQAGYKTKVEPVSTAEYGFSKAKRPMNSRLSKEKLSKNGFARLPDWKDALHRFLLDC